jgi:hypothetical protein
VSGKPVPSTVKYRVDQRDKQIDRSTGIWIGEGRNLHHRQLRSRGGGNVASNLITLSGSGTTGTHGYMHANPAIATHYGFIVPSWAEPELVPIRLATALGRHQWALLGDVGNVVPLTADQAESTMRLLGIWSADEQHL